MQTKKANKPGGVSQHRGRNLRKGISQKQSNVGCGELQRTAHTGSGFVPSSFVLKPITKNIPLLMVQGLQGKPTEFAQEDKQLKAIADLYPSVSKLAGYKDNKRWSETTAPAEVLHHLLSNVDNFYKDDEIGSDYWGIENDGDKYYIETLNTCGSTDPIFIPLDFLSQINRTHKRLHTFLIYAIRLVDMHNKVQLFQDWCKHTKAPGTHGLYYEYLLEREEWQDEEDNNEGTTIDDIGNPYPAGTIKKALNYYGPTGIPTAYCKLLRGGASLREFNKQLAAFVPANELEEKAEKFLHLAYKLASTGIQLKQYCEQPWNNGEATPMEYYVFVWSVDEDDVMEQMFCEVLDDQAQNIGVAPFTWKCRLDDSGDIEQGMEYCKLVKEFFEEGRKMAHLIKSKVKKVKQEYPLPLNPKNKNGKRLVDILV